MGAWYECEDCPFATNSPKEARRHKVSEDHTVNEYED